MIARGLDDEAFAALVGRDRSQISRVRRGKSRPSDDLKAEIVRATGNQVPLESWFDLSREAA